MDSGLQQRQIPRQRVPYRFDIDAITLVTKLVPNATNIAPRQTWTKHFRLLTKTHGRFAKDLQFALNSGYRFWILSERIQVHILCELLNGNNCIQYVA